MLYIHTLKDLSPKSLEIESTPLVREIKQNNKYPLSESGLKDHLLSFFVSATDLELMSKSLELIPRTVEEIDSLPPDEEIYEQISLKRARSVLQELPEALQKNIQYAQLIFEAQELLISQITFLLNKVPELRTTEEKVDYDQQMSIIFEMILRNGRDFRFNFIDIVHEGPLAQITNLVEGLSQNFFFHVQLEEYLKKQDFGAISQRISPAEIEKVNCISQQIVEIQKGVQRAHDLNMRMTNLAVVLYSYIKWLRS